MVLASWFSPSPSSLTLLPSAQIEAVYLGAANYVKVTIHYHLTIKTLLLHTGGHGDHLGSEGFLVAI